MDYRIFLMLLHPIDVIIYLHRGGILREKYPYTSSIYGFLHYMKSVMAVSHHTWDRKFIQYELRNNYGITFDMQNVENLSNRDDAIDQLIYDYYEIVNNDCINAYLCRLYRQMAYEFTQTKDFNEFVHAYHDKINSLRIDQMALSREVYTSLPYGLQDNEHRLMIDNITAKVIYYIDIILQEYKKVINGGNTMGKHWLEKRVPVYGTTESEQLREAVNDFDKMCGCRLKHPEEVPEGKKGYREMVFSAKAYFSKLILILNRMNSDDYVSYSKIFGDTLKKIKINSDFKDASAWFDDESHVVSNLAYKSRFLTYLTNWVIKNLDEIIDKLYILDDTGDLLKYDYKMEHVEKITMKLALLIERMLTGCGDYKSLMIYFFDLQAYVEGDMKGIKQQERKINDIHEQTFILSNRLKMFSGADNDVTMDTLIKLAYLTTTSESKVKNVFKFYNGYKFSDKATTREIISHLGKKILASYERDKTIPKMFKFFIKADPLVYSKWEDVNSDKRLLVGTIALKYYAFMTNDKRIIRKVNSLIGD